MTKRERFEVDQSIRIENLSQDTVIGVGNKKISFALIIPKKVKRHFQEDFRLKGRPKHFPPLLFAAGIAVLLQKFSLHPTILVIDSEYSSHENLIIRFLEQFYPDTIISIEQVGKSSPSHEAAYFTHTGKRKPNGKITIQDLHKVLLKPKTTGELHHLEFTRIHKSSRSVSKKYTRKKR